jgi:hypothetical protein
MYKHSSSDDGTVCMSSKVALIQLDVWLFPSSCGCFLLCGWCALPHTDREANARPHFITHLTRGALRLSQARKHITTMPPFRDDQILVSSYHCHSLASATHANDDRLRSLRLGRKPPSLNSACPNPIHQRASDCAHACSMLRKRANLNP